MNFFTDHPVLFALVCAGVAVAYGLGLTFWLLKQPAGTQFEVYAVEGSSLPELALVAPDIWLPIGMHSQLGSAFADSGTSRRSF